MAAQVQQGARRHAQGRGAGSVCFQAAPVMLACLRGPCCTAAASGCQQKELMPWPAQLAAAGDSYATPWAGLCQGTWQEQLPGHSQSGPLKPLAGGAQSPLDGLEHTLLLGVAVQVAVCEATVGGARRKNVAGKMRQAAEMGGLLGKSSCS